MNDDKDFKPEDEMTPEEQNAIKESEDFVLNFTDEDYEDPEKVEELKKHQNSLKTTIHQKRHFRTKAEELKKNPPAPEKKETPPVKKDADSDERADITEFRQDHPELSKQVVKDIFAYAKTVEKKPEEVMDSAVVKSIISTSEAKDDVEDASVKSGNKSGNGIEKKDWSTASEAEIIKKRNEMGVY